MFIRTKIENWKSNIPLIWNGKEYTYFQVGGVDDEDVVKLYLSNNEPRFSEIIEDQADCEVAYVDYEIFNEFKHNSEIIRITEREVEF